MQALFYLAMFGIFYTFVSFITVGASETSIALKQKTIEATKDVFADMEYAINKAVFLAEGQPDLSNYLIVKGSGNDIKRAELAQFIGWSASDMQKDPWGNDLYVNFYVEEDYILHADNAGGVKADVVHFLIASPGPDGEYSIEPPKDSNAIRGYDKDPDSDDIIRKFETTDAMREVWARALKVEQQVISNAIESYRQQMANFEPIVSEWLANSIANPDSKLRQELDNTSSVKVCGTAVEDGYKVTTAELDPNKTGGSLNIDSGKITTESTMDSAIKSTKESTYDMFAKRSSDSGSYSGDGAVNYQQDSGSSYLQETVTNVTEVYQATSPNNTEVTNCYFTDLKNDESKVYTLANGSKMTAKKAFPRMNGGNSNIVSGSKQVVDLDVYGAEKAVSEDPFGGAIDAEYNDSTPQILTINRKFAPEGSAWNIDRKIIVNGLELLE